MNMLLSNQMKTMLSEKYPFITVCQYAQDEYVGIVQNQDDQITTMYDFGSIIDVNSKQRFIELGNIWWWESNRLIPINIFLKHDWEEFKQYLRTFINRDLQVIHGPICSLTSYSKQHSKRKTIIMVKKPKC